MISPPLLVPIRPLVYVQHCAPSGSVKVRLSGSTKEHWFDTRDQALAFARAIGGAQAQIFEHVARERKR